MDGEELANMICDVLLTKKDKKFTESGPCEHPWLKYAGMFADDPDWEDFQESLRQYREDGAVTKK